MLQLANALACSSTSAPKPTEKSWRHPAAGGRLRLDRLDGLAQGRFGLGVDVGDALLVLALDLTADRIRASTVIRFFA